MTRSNLKNLIGRGTKQLSERRRWSPGYTAFVAALGLAACQNTAPPASYFDAVPAEVTVGDPVTLSWRSTGAATCTLTTGQRLLTPKNCDQGEVTERYDRAGTFLTELAYTEGGVTLIRTAEVTVRAAAKGSEGFTAQHGGLSVTFAAKASAPDTRFTWTFGDGQTGSGAHVVHRYARAGAYLVTLTHTTGTDETQPTSSSRTVTVAAPEKEPEAVPGQTVLFSGDGLTAWKRVRGGAANWHLEGDYAEVKPGRSVGDNNLRTKETFGDFRLHLEFWVPKTPPGTSEQAQGNSGVYLQGRYEVQILNAYGHTLSGQNDAGAIYEVKDASQNASLPPETWQRYDVAFRAARFENGKKVKAARVSVWWNGQLVQDETVIPGPTRLGDPETSAAADAAGVLAGPIVLQDHGHRVRFRNLWVEALR